MVAPTQDNAAPAQSAVVVYFDGLCEPTNPSGYGCGGWYAPAHPALPAHEGLSGHRCYGHGEGLTNNVAEYNAALDALRALYRTGYRGAVELRGDSKLVVEQYAGRWACNAPALQGLLTHLRRAAEHFASVVLIWLPREQNAAADALSRRAYAIARRGGA